MKIKIGIKGNQTKIVENKDTALKFESGLAEVFATPSMIALMEKTAYLSIEDFLEEGFSTVGISINAKHQKASLPGAIITCESKVVKVDGKKVFFEIIATDENGQIGEASHIRYIIDQKQFMDQLVEKQ